MTEEELKEALEREGFDPSSYDLRGGLLSERYTLACEEGVWSVYYSERGLQSGHKSFAGESEACEYLLQIMRDDPTTKR
jgi:hypothetical protein